MRARDPHEPHRAASSLELFFDLVFVVAVGVASAQLHHALSADHIVNGVLMFALVFFAIWWAWMNFTWFATSFDVDDWLYRVLTFVQMGGVLVMAAGIAPVFEHHDFRVLVWSYVVMRIAMVAQWLRAAASEQTLRTTTLTYAAGIAIVQVLWVLSLALPAETMPVAVPLLVIAELAVPIVAERRRATPWHPHHIAERYSALTIVTLGEGVVGTVAILQAVVEEEGWTTESAVFGLSAMVMIFAMWWIYFTVPVGDALHLNQSKCFQWGYGHTVIFMSAAATGAGLEVAALWTEHEAKISAGAVVACVAVPLGIYCLSVLGMYDYLVKFDPVSLLCAVGAVALLVAGVWMAFAGVSLTISVVVVALAPVFIVIVDEAFRVPRRAQALVDMGLDVVVS